MVRVRKMLGGLVLAVVAVEVVLVLTGVIDFRSAARFVIVMELCLSVFLIMEIAIVVKAVRRARSLGIDLPVALDESLAMYFPAIVARYVRQDLMLVRALFMLTTGRRDVAEDDHPIAYSGPLVMMLVALTMADGIVVVALHQILPVGVRYVVLVLGLIGLVWLAGFVASLVCYPHVVSANRLRLRFSVFHDVVVPTAAVRSVVTTTAAPRTQKSAERFDDELLLVVGGQANVVVDLEPTDFSSLNPKVSATGKLTRVAFYADQPATVRRLLETIRKT